MARTTKSESASLDAATRICVLHGAEEMLKKEHLNQLRQAMADAHGEVETLMYSGQTAQLSDVFDELRSYGLMQQHKIVIVDEADEFTKRYRPQLESYADSPVDNATLVLRATRWYPGNLDKAIKRVGAVVKCEPLKAADAERWLIQRAQREYKRKLDPPIARLLVDRLGSGLMRLDSEFAKLTLMVGDKQPITAELIDQIIGRASDEDAWAVQEAVLASLATGAPRGKTPAGMAIEKIHELVDLSREADVLVAYFVADLIRKLHLATMMRKQGEAEGQIARELKLWGPRQAMFMNVLRRLDERTTARLFDRIVSLEARSKSGLGKPMRNIEGFCAIVADEIR